MDENTKTERSETETNNEEVLGMIRQLTMINRRMTRLINVKVKRIIAKLEKTLKDVNDTVKAVQYVTLKGIQSGC